MTQPLSRSDKVVLFGGAGLVGQNLVVLLKESGYSNLLVIDKHAANVDVLRRLNPDVSVLVADMADPGGWEDAIAGAQAAVMLQAHIGGLVEAEFIRNSVDSTKRALAACERHRVPYIVHISSSVVNSLARDWYTETKKAQEALVAASPIPHVILRPTLMFGWFDRKHLGWLARFMKRSPIFPIPGSGRYLRQPLFELDFCRIIQSCLEKHMTGAYDITGREKVDYIDIVRAIKQETKAGAAIVRIPYSLFWLLLTVYGLMDRNPPFTTKQLKALVTPDTFDLIPWWDIFGVPSTPFADAIHQTYSTGPYANVVLEF
jgi:uncharacterized protein YbjT (DUF2867 family)